MFIFRLVGRYPFHEPDPKSMFAKISRAQFTFPESLSYASRDLVHNLLRRKPSERLTADQILSHPWLKRMGMYGMMKSICYGLRFATIF